MLNLPISTMAIPQLDKENLGAIYRVSTIAKSRDVGRFANGEHFSSGG